MRATTASLTRTILFLNLFYEVDSSPAVKRGIQSWHKHLSESSGGPLEVRTCYTSTCGAAVLSRLRTAHCAPLRCACFSFDNWALLSHVLKRSYVTLQEVVCDLMYRLHIDDENILEPLVLLCVLTSTGAGPVLAPPCPFTSRWTITTPDDVPFPYLIVDSLAKQGCVCIFASW